METDIWARKYEEHEKFLDRKFEYLWKGKYPCRITSKIGLFAVVVYFPDDDAYLTVDNLELHVPDKVREIILKKTSHKCDYTNCSYGCGSAQALGKHYVKLHGASSKTKKKEGKNDSN